MVDKCGPGVYCDDFPHCYDCAIYLTEEGIRRFNEIIIISLAKKFQERDRIAQDNPKMLLSGRMGSKEAAEIMRQYDDAKKELFDALDKI